MRTRSRQEGSTDILLPDADLAVLYERRRVVEDAIHALERYQRLQSLGLQSVARQQERAA